MAATIISSRRSDGEKQDEPQQSEHLMQCAQELISAIHEKDAERVASTLGKLVEYAPKAE